MRRHHIVTFIVAIPLSGADTGVYTHPHQQRGIDSRRPATLKGAPFRRYVRGGLRLYPQVCITRTPFLHFEILFIFITRRRMVSDATVAGSYQRATVHARNRRFGGLSDRPPVLIVRPLWRFADPATATATAIREASENADPVFPAVGIGAAATDPIDGCQSRPQFEHACQSLHREPPCAQAQNASLHRLMRDMQRQRRSPGWRGKCLGVCDLRCVPSRIHPIMSTSLSNISRTWPTTSIHRDHSPREEATGGVNLPRSGEGVIACAI